GPTVISYFAAGPHPRRLSRLASRLAAYFVATFRLVNFQLLNVPIDEAFLILGRDVLLDPLRRDANRQIGGVADQLALGDLHVLIDLPARLVQEPLAFSRRSRLNAGLLRGDFLRALRAQRVELAGQRFHPALDLLHLRGRLLLQLGGIHEIAANLRAAVGEIRPKRRSQQVDERAGENREVHEARDHVGDPAALVFLVSCAFMRRSGLRGGGAWLRMRRLRRNPERPAQQQHGGDDTRGGGLVPSFTSWQTGDRRQVATHRFYEAFRPSTRSTMMVARVSESRSSWARAAAACL